MKAQEIRQETEAWQECDEPQSQNPRHAVSEWLGRKPYLDRAVTYNPNSITELTGQEEHLDFAQGSFKTSTTISGRCDLTAVWIETQNRMDLCDRKLTNSSSPVSAESEFVRDFNKKAERWKRDTSFQSSLVAQFMHDDYQTIMAMGERVIPLILGRLQKVPENWFWALKHLAGEDVAKDTDNLADATKAWLKWARNKGHID